MHNVKGPNVCATIMGIKCDNKYCEFADMSVKVEDYHLWLNKPCPNCGENLLTQADYDLVKFQLDTAERLNKIFLPKDKPHTQARMQGHYDGSGIPTYSDIEIVAIGEE